MFKLRSSRFACTTWAAGCLGRKNNFPEPRTNCRTHWTVCDEDTCFCEVAESCTRCDTQIHVAKEREGTAIVFLAPYQGQPITVNRILPWNQRIYQQPLRRYLSEPGATVFERRRILQRRNRHCVSNRSLADRLNLAPKVKGCGTL